MRKNWFEYLMFLTVLILVFIFSDNYYALMFLAAAISVPILSFVLLLFTYWKVSLSFAEQSGVTDGREIMYMLENTSPFPAISVLWDIDMESCISKSVTRQSLMSAVKGRGQEQICLAVENGRTGKVNIYTTQVRVYDFLGLFFFKIKAPEPKSMLNYPQTHNLQLSIHQLEVSEDDVRYSQNRAGADVNEAFSFHEYVAGDAVRNIHWKLSSKTDTLIVRDFGLPQNHPVILLLELISDDPARDEKMLSACFDTFFSISSALLDRGVPHSIAWFDTENDVFRLEEVGDFQELEMYLPEILGICAYGDRPSAIMYYEEYLPPGASVLLYYVTSAITPKILDFSLYQKVKTVYIGEAHKIELDDAVTDQLEIVPVFKDNEIVTELVI